MDLVKVSVFGGLEGEIGREDSRFPGGERVVSGGILWRW